MKSTFKKALMKTKLNKGMLKYITWYSSELVQNLRNLTHERGLFFSVWTVDEGRTRAYKYVLYSMYVSTPEYIQRGARFAKPMMFCFSSLVSIIGCVVLGTKTGTSDFAFVSDWCQQMAGVWSLPVLGNNSLSSFPSFCCENLVDICNTQPTWLILPHCRSHRTCFPSYIQNGSHFFVSRFLQYNTFISRCFATLFSLLYALHCSAKF